MATAEDIMNAIRNADAAGDSDSVRQLGAVLQQMQVATQRQARIDALKKSNPAEYDPDSPEYKAKNDPTNGMSTTEKVLAGAGKAFADTGRGVGQLLRKVMPDKAADAIGLPSQQDIDNAKERDRPLMRTGAARVGNVGGNVALTLPTVFIPGVNSVTGAGLTGAVLGGVQPVASDDSRLSNILWGGVGGVGGNLAVRGLAAGYQGLKGLVEPFYQTGRDAIAGRLMQRFGLNAGDLAGLSSTPTITGARPTLAEQVVRPEGAAGAAQMQDALRAADPSTAAAMAAREMENNAARVSTLRDMAGEGGKREMFEAAREAAAKQNYGDAFANAMDTSSMSAAQRGELAKLMKMPAIRDAIRGAQEIAQNQGANLANRPQGSVEGLHNIKLALDDQINALSNGTASQVNKSKAIQAARDRLVTFIQNVAPEYGVARAEYASMSQPLNQMDIAEQLFRKGTSATSDLGGTPRLMPNSFINQLKNEDALVKSATGRDLGKLSQVLDPETFAKVQAIGQELDKAAAVARTGAGPGSPTAQRLASNNLLRQTLGPTGLPQSWSESTLLNTFMKPAQMVYNGVAEPKIQAVLSDLLLNPDKAAKVLAVAQKNPTALPPALRDAIPMLEQALRTVPAAAAVSSQR